jgi:hypothetical protein
MGENNQAVYADRGIEVRALYVEWLEDLVFDHMLAGIREVQSQELQARSEDLAWQAQRAEYHQWAIGELTKFAITALYHQWERDLKGLCIECFGKVLKANQGPECQACKRSPQGNDGLVSALLDGIQIEMAAYDWTLTVSLDDRRILNECRELTNVIKHDVGDGYDKIAKAYPVHFVAGNSPPQDRFRITPDELRRLFTGVKGFWEDLEKVWPA